ncbi:hypothetical protein C1H46_042235 [Malus baccata]|uniref:Cupin type-1 domain-containing protein n=1 Tax=Malus baccata TaxID=106549 RepID=A0A540KDB8_MALBA|nr:hypothetical protein C1H46_042235 [Malus baccata]
MAMKNIALVVLVVAVCISAAMAAEPVKGAAAANAEPVKGAAATPAAATTAAATPAGTPTAAAAAGPGASAPAPSGSNMNAVGSLLSKDLELLLDTPIEYNSVLQLERKATDFVVVGRTEIGGKEDEVLQ